MGSIAAHAFQHLGGLNSLWFHSHHHLPQWLHSSEFDQHSTVRSFGDTFAASLVPAIVEELSA